MSLDEIKQRIEKAEKDAGREAGSTHLIAVSKVQPNQRVEAVLQEGHRLYGEIRVQEAAGKWPDFRGMGMLCKDNQHVANQQGPSGDGVVRGYPFGRPSQISQNNRASGAGNGPVPGRVPAGEHG